MSILIEGLDIPKRQAIIVKIAPDGKVYRASTVFGIPIATAVSAAPEQKTGKWKETDDGWDGTYYVCSECGCPWTLIDGTPLDNGMNYCPNCGCKMEVEE